MNNNFEKDIVYDYEQFLMGNSKHLSSLFFPAIDNNTEERVKNNTEKYACFLLKYVIETYLHWTPKEAAKWFNKETITRTKLETVISRISVPVELNPEKDYYWYIHKCYPSQIRVSERSLILNVYKKVLDGKIPKFPKGFLEGLKGKERVHICINYAISTMLENTNIEDLYKMFSTPEGTKFLKNAKLDGARRQTYYYAIDLLHASLPRQQQDENLYQKYKFIHLFNKKLKDNGITRRTIEKYL